MLVFIIGILSVFPPLGILDNYTSLLSMSSKFDKIVEIKDKQTCSIFLSHLLNYLFLEIKGPSDLQFEKLMLNM